MTVPPQGAWVAMTPVGTLILAVDGGERPLAMAQRRGHQVTQVLASHGAPLFRTAGFGAYLTARVPHDGQWMSPERRQAKGPQPQPRWMPSPGLLSVPGGKRSRRQRLVGGKPRVIFGAAQTIESILAKQGWTINTAFAERLHLDVRPHGAAIGRRVTALCTHAVGLRQQWAIFQTYPNFVRPHARWRVPLPALESVPGTAAIKCWQPRTPAMAVGLPNRRGSRRAVLLYRVPPWPQPPRGSVVGRREDDARLPGICVSNGHPAWQEALQTRWETD